MTLSDADEARVVRLLSQDVAATLGPGHDEVIRETASRVRTFRDEPADYVDKVVEDVQQAFHDDFVDTTWPSCPTHPNHPLWFHDGHWVCERNHVRVAPLGQLSNRADPNSSRIQCPSP
jgi:hypothetical protein